MRQCTDFQTKYGMWSGPGAEVFQDLERALDITSEVRGVSSSWHTRRRSWVGGGLGGNQWSRSVSATSAGSEAPGRSGNICGGRSNARPNTNLLAVVREYGVAEDKKSDQCVFLAEAMALKYVLLELFTLLQLRGNGSRWDILANL